MTQVRRRFTGEFKREAVALLQTSGRLTNSSPLEGRNLFQAALNALRLLIPQQALWMPSISRGISL